MEFVHLDALVTVVCAVFASSGLWSFLSNKASHRNEDRKTKDNQKRLLLGLCYRSICDLATQYLNRGCVTTEEYEDLKKYLYDPYRDLGGDGTCAMLMEKVDKLPIRKDD